MMSDLSNGDQFEKSIFVKLGNDLVFAQNPVLSISLEAQEFVMISNIFGGNCAVSQKEMFMCVIQDAPVNPLFRNKTPHHNPSQKPQLAFTFNY